jgi:hypothetical protein
MANVPDSSNFYSSLQTALSAEQIAGLFRAQGWQVRETDTDRFELACPWAKLVVESESPVLLHGPVADVQANAERVLAVLRKAGVAFTAESFDAGGELLREWKSDPA